MWRNSVNSFNVTMSLDYQSDWPMPPTHDGHEHWPAEKAASLRGADERCALAIDVDAFCRKLVDDAPDAIIYADAKGVICFWNHGAERIFGFSQFDALGKTLDIIIPETFRKRHWDGYARTVRTGVTRYGAADVLAVPAIRKDGLRISIEFTILPFTRRNKEVIGIAAIIRDVTSRFKEVKELREKLAAVAQSSTSTLKQN
jgi:PAS domain S-box-containing protein